MKTGIDMLSIVEKLKLYDGILVTGCYRTGSTICGKMLACDLGYRYTDEWDYIPYPVERCNLIRWLQNFFHKNQQVVLQFPIMSSVAHLIASSKVAVVFMQRNLEDIRRSMRKFHLSPQENNDVANDCRYYEEITGISDLDLPAIKSYYWQNYQSKFEHCYVQQYNDLRGHKLWLDKNKRNGFTVKQTSRRTNKFFL